MVVLAAGIVLTTREVNAGPLAMAFAGVAVLLVKLVPRYGFKILGLVIAGLMSAPWLFGWLSQGTDFATAADSSSYRAAIWQRVIALINEHPLTGGGLGVLRTVNETIQTGAFAGQLTIPNHAHNMMLQLWAETGAIGAGLLSLAIVLAGWRMPDARSLGAGGLRAAAIAGAMLAVGASRSIYGTSGGGRSAVCSACWLLPRQPASRRRQPGMRRAGLTFGEPTALAAAERPAAPAQVAPLPATYGQQFQPAQIGFRADGRRLSRDRTAGDRGLASNGGLVEPRRRDRRAGLLRPLRLSRLGQPRANHLTRPLRRETRPAPVARLCHRDCRERLLALSFVPDVRADLSSVGRYLGWNLAFLNFMEPALPGVFEANRFTEINGALWTLKIEVMFYLVLPLLALVLLAANAAVDAVRLIYSAPRHGGFTSSRGRRACRARPPAARPDELLRHRHRAVRLAQRTQLASRCSRRSG